MSEVQVISCGADALAARYNREVLGKDRTVLLRTGNSLAAQRAQSATIRLLRRRTLWSRFLKGRGTWNTIYLAWKKGIPVDVFPIK